MKGQKVLGFRFTLAKMRSMSANPQCRSSFMEMLLAMAGSIPWRIKISWIAQELGGGMIMSTFAKACGKSPLILQILYVYVRKITIMKGLNPVIQSQVSAMMAGLKRVLVNTYNILKNHGCQSELHCCQ